LQRTGVAGGTIEFPSYELLIDAVRDGTVDGYILRRDQRPWRLSQYALDSAVLQEGVDGAPNVSELRMDADRIGVHMIGPDAPPRFVNGREEGPGTATLLAPGSLIGVTSPAATTWLALSASSETVRSEAALLAGGDGLILPTISVTVDSAPRDVAALRALVLGATGALGSVPRGMHPEAVRNLDRTLLRTLAAFALDASPRLKRRYPLRVNRTTALRSVFGFLRTLSSEPAYVEDLCQATGLPERTLRLIFLEQFGESPVRVLRSRRLCLAFEALRAPGVGLKQIRPVAESCGFWHMGQFSVDYRKLIGERPSDTVRRTRVAGSRERIPRMFAGTPIPLGLAAVP
jgi:AraC-like DNA-binding protein